MLAKVLLLGCLAVGISAAPQVRSSLIAPQLRSSIIAPQLIRQGAYLQPHLLRSLPLQYDRSYMYPQAVDYNTYTGLPGLAAQQVYRAPLAADSRSAAILRQAQDATLDGAYSYGFESQDGISVQTNAGPAIPVGPEDTIQTVSGSFSYTAPDGTPITTNWVADENGYRAEGAHLPKPPQ